MTRNTWLLARRASSGWPATRTRCGSGPPPAAAAASRPTAAGSRPRPASPQMQQRRWPHQAALSPRHAAHGRRSPLGRQQRVRMRLKAQAPRTAACRPRLRACASSGWCSSARRCRRCHAAHAGLRLSVLLLGMLTCAAMGLLLHTYTVRVYIALWDTACCIHVRRPCRSYVALSPLSAVQEPSMRAQEAIRRVLDACLLTDAELAAGPGAWAAWPSPWQMLEAG